MNRATRRHHYERMKAKAIRRERMRHMPRLDPRRIGLLANTPHPCSCYACGNPRRHFGEVTIQEKRAA